MAILILTSSNISQLTQSNTVFVVQSTVNLNSNTFTVGQDCIFRFEGGKLSNGQLQTNSTTSIEGSGQIFDSTFSFANNSRLNEQELKAEWFGVRDSDNDCTAAINRAIAACYSTLIRILSFNSGLFRVKGVVNVGTTTSGNNLDHRKYWYLQIRGAGQCNFGTFFWLSNNGQFIVDQINPDMGPYRGGGIYNCRFYTYNDSTPGVPQLTAIYMKYAHTYTIYNCSFEGFTNAILTTGRTYYMDIRSCTFYNCTNGILGENDNLYGAPNENVVANCMFSGCTYPVDVSTGDGWHIMDTDFEGENGTVKLSRRGRMTNVRLERNLSDMPWLEVGSECIVDAAFHEYDGVSSTAWRCIVTGDNNILRLHYYGSHTRAFMSYSRGNRIDASCNDTPNVDIRRFVFDPEDEFVLNGYSNKHDYVGTNLITATTLTPNTSTSSYGVSCSDGTCWPIPNSTSNVTVLSLPTTHYKSCKFCLKGATIDTVKSVNIFGSFSMKVKDKWFSMVVAQKISEATNSTTVTLCSYNSSYRTYIRDVVISAIPLYNRPVLAEVETNTLNQRQPDGIIHLQQTYLNHIVTEFCLVPYRLQHYSNLIGKSFYYSSSQQKYYTGSQELLTNSYVNGHVIETPSNSGSLAWLLRDMLNVDVELYDLQGNHLFFQARRNSTSNYFTITVTDSVGMSYNTNNTWGTVEINEYPRVVIPWIKKA